LDAPTKAKIRETVLKLRDLLESDLETELKRYGIYVDRKPIPSQELSHLKKDDLSKKEVMEKSIDKEIQRGLNRADATRYFIKEMAFTYLNRLVGLKCMESRGFRKEVITQRPEYGNRSLCHKELLEQNPELRKEPDEGLRELLLQVSTEITDEIGVLFDPQSEYSQIFPSLTALKEAIKLINENIPKEAWKENELLGWVYQYFSSKEKDRIFEEINKKKKISGPDIIPVTQLYTEKYIVRFLVENSLGALWQEMHPQSKLKEAWEYFVEDPNNFTREPKPLKEIKILDPACGSGHFLLYAFELLYQMYVEEGAVPKEEIPSKILKYNLFGIDIDLRSIQIAALALYMKAKNYNPMFKVEQINLVCADAILLNSDKLQELLDDYKGDYQAQRVIETIWQGLQNVREIGSLLKVEEQVDEVIVEEEKKMAAPLLAEVETWADWKKKLLNSLSNYYEEASESFDVSRQMFANEAIKGINLLDLFEQKYDVVMTNPPYMGGRNMGNSLKEALGWLYPITKADLYAAFIERCLQLAKGDGFVAMITQQSFMFITSFEKLRKMILNSCLVKTMAHLGPHAFQDVPGEKVNSTMFSLKNMQVDGEEKGVFIRLIKDENKEKALNEAIKEGDASKKFFAVPQKNLKIIDGWPFVYWVSDGITRLFQAYAPLSKALDIPGSQNKTANNEKYTRYVWEPHEDSIGPNKKWVVYAKGGEYCKWAGNLDIVVDWSDRAREFYKSNPTSNLLDARYWYRKGITFTATTSKGFSARLLLEGCVFDMKGPSAFGLNQNNNGYFLGFLNSMLCNYFLNLLSSAVDFQVIDLKRLPFKPVDRENEFIIEKLGKSCVNNKHVISEHIINECNFKRTAIEFGKEQSNGNKLLDFYKTFLSHKESLLLNLHTYESLIDYEVFKLYEIDGEDLIQILEEQGIPPAWYPILDGYAEIPEDMLPEAKGFLLGGREQMLKDFKIEGFIPEKPSLPLDKLKERFTKLYLGEEKPNVNQATEDYVEDIAIDLGINPVSVLALRKEMDLVNPSDYKHEVENFLTYHLIEGLKEDPDGIIPITSIPGHQTALEHLRKRLEMVFGEDKAYDIEQEMHEPLGKPLEKWLERDFFNKHIKQYKKRPIVWQIESSHGTFKVLVYYHRLTSDTLKRLKTIYLWKLRDTLAYRLGENRKQLTKSSGG